MLWLVGFGLLGVALVGAVSIVVHVNQQRFAARVAAEMRALLAIPSSHLPRSGGTELPEIVERYRRIAVGDRAPVQTLRLRHGGTFCLSPASKPRPIEGVQLFTADPPGFVWQGRVGICPGVWVDARDMVVDGKGSMRVLVDDTFTVADARGPALDQGSALRLLAELVWYPTALFDERIVTWDAIDAHRARATFRAGASVVVGVFEFGADGMPLEMTAERFDDKGRLRRWGGTYGDWRTVDGMRVPFEAEVSWHDPTFVYAHWVVDSMEYDELIVLDEVAGLDNPVPSAPLGRLARAAMVLEVVLGVGAIGGGLALMIGPRGEIIPLPLSALVASPFATYFIPGAILFAVLGVGSLVGAVLTHRRDPLAPFLAFAIGTALIIWILVEIAIVGYSNDPPLQALYLGLGIVISVLGGTWIRSQRTPMILARPVITGSGATTG